MEYYGPDVDGYEYDRWGTYHRADHFGIGVDRTANGTGKTVIQHIYDAHFEGAEEAEQFLILWNELEGLIGEEEYKRTRERFIHQRDHAKEWRDVINSYFYRKTGIADEKGRIIY